MQPDEFIERERVLAGLKHSAPPSLETVARRPLARIDGDAANLSAIAKLPGQIAALTGHAIPQAAQTYLDLRNYVKVTLMPEVK